jgi:hypothetical protein
MQLRATSAMFAFLSLALVFASCSDEDDRDAGLESAVNSYFAQLKKGNHRVSLDRLDPRFDPDGSARQRAVSVLEKSTKTFTYHSFTHEAPIFHFTGSNSIHCFVPYTADAQIGSNRATIYSHLLATRYQASNTWHFVDVGTKSSSELSNYYENLPKRVPGSGRLK